MPLPKTHHLNGPNGENLSMSIIAGASVQIALRLTDVSQKCVDHFPQVLLAALADRGYRAEEPRGA